MTNSNIKRSKVFISLQATGVESYPKALQMDILSFFLVQKLEMTIYTSDLKFCLWMNSMFDRSIDTILTRVDQTHSGQLVAPPFFLKITASSLLSHSDHDDTRLVCFHAHRISTRTISKILQSSYEVRVTW